MKRTSRLNRGVLAALTLVTLACSSSRVKTVDPGLYKSLPGDVRGQGLSELDGKLRVIDGKIAKAKADIGQANQEFLLAQKDVEQRHAELNYTRASLREMKKQSVTESEIRHANEKIQLAHHQWKLAKYNEDYKKQTRVTLEEQIKVLEAERNVIYSQIELTKIQQVHEFTNYRVPDADLQVAGFKKQLRRFEVEESRAKYKLAQRELAQARDKQKLRQWEAMAPVTHTSQGTAAVENSEATTKKEIRSEQKKPRYFWQNLFSRRDADNKT